MIQRVSASGGAATPITEIEASSQESWHRFPSFIPGSARFLFTLMSENANTTGIYVASLDAPKQRIRLAPGDTKALYAPPWNGYPGYLLWLRDSTLVAQRFDGKSHVEGELSR